MSVLHTIISTLPQEDKKDFLRNLKRKNKRNDTKNIELFTLLDAPIERTKLDEIIYSKPSKGAYHALCKRLHDSLIDFIATKSFKKESSEEMNALKLILASQFFFQQNKINIAFKTLGKAELIAVKYSLFSILNEIYHTQMHHAHLNKTLKLQHVISKYQANKLNIQQEENLNLFYATIQAELNQSNPEVPNIINRNLQLFNISITKNLSYQSLFKILQISNQIAHVTRNYHAILPFIKNTCKAIDASERYSEKHLYDHLQVLYYLANTYFRIKNFKEATNFLKEMHTNMLLEKSKYYTIFYPQYILLENLLLIYTGNNKTAIRNLQEFNFEKHKTTPEYSLDLKLTLVVSLFLNKNYKEAFNIYKGFYHSDQWYISKVGYIWVIQKNLIEILLLIELDYVELVTSRLNSFRKKHRAHLINHKESIILNFIKLISIYFYKTEDIHSEKFKEKVALLLKVKTIEEDIFTISFYAWLKAKINKSEVYKTSLEYINDLL
ncbi:hypothetical protein SAMN06265371_103267 [Lutibacter agarilyticus]|uniref:Tetratricopeptide repeat-containing protein n=1 Tax=Lutibacter agarilyticus TaxID=1109740 RepID=A0A238WIT2_9FLAO|nr:hypothetical protein [Lutibacter agarilyticus]SNR46460.1 hypothetical protein SAMN06265371_103267 [Lutibacter agarilyticus]